MSAALPPIAPTNALATSVNATATESDLLAELERVFGYTAFRPHQEDAVRAALAGRDCLVVMPTGAGKSLTFQLPAAMTEGVTIVISPLIALMRDQIIALNERTSFVEEGAFYLNSSQTMDEQRDVLSLVRAGRVKLLYITPERLRSGAFLELLQSIQIARLVVDEAHCISEWGHDFRPDYLAIKDIVATLGDVPRFAVTATATRRVQGSIAENLGMTDPEIIVGGFDRPNLHWSVVRCKNDAERDSKLYKALPKLMSRGGSGLIYVSTRKACEKIGELALSALAPLGIRAGCYHAGMDNDSRSKMQEAWLRGDIPVLVATNAFGMGIDKPDVRFVVHYGYPESPESYYQEAGRAGRDGKKARVFVLSVPPADRKLREWFINNEAIKVEDFQQVVQKLGRLANGEAVRVPGYWWNQELGWNDPKPRVVLARLERAGLVERLSENQEGIELRPAVRSIPAAQMGELRRGLEHDVNERLERLNEMAGYVKTIECRRAALINYFGDADELIGGGAGCCDNCDARAKGIDLSAQTPKMAQGRVEAPSQISDVYELLQALDALWPSVGKTRLIKILRGSNAADMERYLSAPVYGALRGVSVAKATAFVDELLDRALLHQGDEDEYYVVNVTRVGREAWEARAGVDDLELPGRSRASASNGGGGAGRASSFAEDDDDTLDAAQGALFETLRSWRSGQARQEGVPPYIVFGDKVLREIARQAPSDLDELGDISGIGPAKLDKYGETVLELLGGE